MRVAGEMAGKMTRNQTREMYISMAVCVAWHRQNCVLRGGYGKQREAVRPARRRHQIDLVNNPSYIIASRQRNPRLMPAGAATLSDVPAQSAQTKSNLLKTSKVDS